jgi:hypothetical protein
MNFAGIRPLQPVQAADQRRLSCTAATDNSKDFAFIDAQGNAIESRCASETTPNLDKPDHGFGGGSLPLFRGERSCMLVHRAVFPMPGYHFHPAASICFTRKRGPPQMQQAAFPCAKSNGRAMAARSFGSNGPGETRLLP